MIKALIISSNKKSLVMICLASLLCLLVFYIIQINSLTSNNYLFKDSQKSLQKLNQENEQLESDLVGVGSLARAEERISDLGFEKTGKIHYIQILEGAVAAAK